MANKHTAEDKKKITRRTLLVLLSFILSYCIMGFISIRNMPESVPDNVTGLKPASFRALSIYEDGSFGLTNPFHRPENEHNNSCCKNISDRNLEPSYSIPKGKEEYFQQAFQKQIHEMNHGEERGQMSVKAISDDRQEITISIEAGDGYKSYSQYETDGKNIYPKFSMEHYRGYGCNYLIWNFFYALIIAFLTFIGVKLYYRQKLVYYSGIR